MEYQISVAQHATQKALVITQSLAREDIREYLDAAFPEVAALLAQRGVTAAGPPFARYRVDADTFHVTAESRYPTGSRVLDGYGWTNCPAAISRQRCMSAPTRNSPPHSTPSSNGCREPDTQSPVTRGRAISTNQMCRSLVLRSTSP